MSSYRARQDRKTLKRTIARMEREHERLLGEAYAELAEVNRALARSRFDQPVRWDAGGKHVTYNEQPRHFPTIALRMFSYRECIDVGLMRTDRDFLLKHVERIVAQRLADEFVRSDLVAMERARVPVASRPYVEEYDWAIYVGVPVKRNDD